MKRLFYIFTLAAFVLAPIRALAENPPPLLLTWGADILSRPFGVTVGPDGYVYVTDVGHSRICKFTSTGTLVSTIAASGFRCVVSPGGDVYVADTFNFRVEQFTGSGALVRAWGSQGSGPGQFQSPIGIALDSSGNVYVVEDENHRVQKFDATGNYLLQWSVSLNPWGSRSTRTITST